VPLVKYCTQCGKPNDDQAVFCTACGQRFPGQTAPAVPQAGAAPAAQPSQLFAAELRPGAHKHMPTDVYLTDSSGKVQLVARKQSLLHQDYTIVDGNESVTGFIKSEGHLTHTSLNVQDANHSTQASVQLGRIEQQGRAPNCWLEDAGGNKQASIAFTNGILGFSAIKPDGSRIFDAALSRGAGVKQMLDALESKSYAIELFDSGFSLPTLVTIIAAIDHL
jgi:hypothetical protein